MKYTTYFSICLALRRKKVYTLITVHSGKVVWKKDQIDNMEEEMKKMVKRTAVVTLAGVMSVGMLSGCGSKTLDGTKTVATVDGTDIPLGVVTCVTGVSGSGKSSLVNEILYKHLAKSLNRARCIAGDHDGIDGIEQLDKVINIDQSPIGRTPRSNPATYTGVFDFYS